MAITERLYQFDTKATLATADILYCGNSADTFNEVQSTVAGLIGAYPGLLSIGSLTTSANQIIYTTGANTYATSSVSAWGLSLIAEAPSSHTLPVAVSGAGFTYKTLTNGQILIGSTGADPVASVPTAGVGIAISTSAGGFTISATGATTGAFTQIVIQQFPAGGTYTPTAGMQYCTIECMGGGGGGAGTPNSGATGVLIASGGGAGGYSRITTDSATIGASKVVTVGTGGAGGLAGSNAGADGTVTSVGTICVANGGGGGPTNIAGGDGAVAGTGDIAATGMCGLPGVATSLNSTTFAGGGGASTQWGAGGKAVGGTVAGNNGTGYGSGGSGGASSNAGGAHAGGNGAPGYCIITEYINA